MTDRLGGPAEGQTPLDDDDELEGLRLTYISTRGELDAAEQANIVAGRTWALARKRSALQVLDDAFLRRLHREMFRGVWRWAGKYRLSDKKIGVDWLHIAQSVRDLCEDARLWCGAARDDPSKDSAAVEFHHRLVLIHPFVNGNGRHARLTADLLIASMGRTRFSWGQASDSVPTAEGDPVRDAYLVALRRADAGELGPLIAFARS